MMKKILMALVFAFGCLAANAQCGDELMKTALGAMGNYQYIKDFDVKLAAANSKDGQKFTVVLNSRTQYQINIANGATNPEHVKVEVFQGDKCLGSNFYNGKVFDVMQFICTTTGAYKIRVSCENGGDACARAVLSLVKQFSSAEMP